MQELMAQRGGVANQTNPEQQNAQEEAKREADERRQVMLSQIVSSEARERSMLLHNIDPVWHIIITDKLFQYSKDR